MSGRFEGINDAQWDLIATYLPSRKRGPKGGMPPADFRHVINSIFYVLITGCRWCDVPKHEPFASKSSSHRWLKTWLFDGTWERLQAGLQQIADLSGKVEWDRCMADGSFFPGTRRRRG